MRSLRRTLLLSMLLSMASFVTVTAIVIHFELADEFGELYDAELAREAGGALRAPAAREPDFAKEDDDPGADMVVVRWARPADDPVTLAGRDVAGAAALTTERPTKAGYRTAQVANRRWRIYSGQDGQSWVTAAQPVSVRERVTRKIEARFAAPVGALVALAAAVVWLLIGRGLSSLRRFAFEVSERSPAALHPVSMAGLPTELAPVAAALNVLLARLEHALAAQQTFVADAAHELLTPLTALHVHTQALERARTEDRREAARIDLQSGLQRCIRLVRQLLALARQSPDVQHHALAPVDLATIAIDAVSDAHATATARGADLGIAAAQSAWVLGDAEGLRLMLRNLVDNAIKYGPSGGRVDVATGVDVESRKAWLRVSDAGPGIPEADRQRVFDRFFRRPGHAADGSGLGLAIVREIATRHGATVALVSPGTLGGLDVSVSFDTESRIN